MQTSDISRIIQQYVYIEESDLLVKPLLVSATRVCRKISKFCKEKNFPFRDQNDCEEFYEGLKREDKVTCMKDGVFTGMLAFHGDTMSCRMQYLNLAEIEAERWCTFVGRKARGRCKDDQCSNGAYDDVLRKENPRFPGTGGFTCRGEECYEMWPPK